MIIDKTLTLEEVRALRDSARTRDELKSVLAREREIEKSMASCKITVYRRVVNRFWFEPSTTP